ncbi:type III pantothenate kinase [Heliobacterium gestii]|uniref:Type III pantothenate kinase n=1 Tax=Heliomicrobium gestii TaxID=2699 RepID=A0A845L7R7_HELGE|nr:type III pantothenate kinase [Heliomicrobium gestii]MBM7866449.1 type III pantothenate kinase [Heliomicrobium gestii]MZP42767.1 type III pantothenate kinase [Heliomicrobium gestii]
MILAVDVGNTQIILGVYELEPQPELRIHWKLSTDRNRTADEYAILIRNLFRFDAIDPGKIEAIVIASVVPPLMPTLERMSRSYFGLQPIIVGPGLRTGLPIAMENPKELGADRVVNAVAAFERYGGPVIVVDFGTATTFDVISEKGEYLGGAIAPGVAVSTEALFARAAKLPRIELVKPQRVIAKNTITGMQSGIIYGFAGQVDGIVGRMKAELGDQTRVIATGETADLIAPETASVGMIDPLLTLEGLRIIYQRSRNALKS